MRFKMMALVLAFGMASVAASADKGYRITYWSQFSWYGLYSAYGEPDPKVDAAVYKAVLALRKNRDEALAELKPVVEGGTKDPTVLLMYGYLLFESNDLSASRDILGKGAAAAAEPGRPEWVRTWVRGACLQWQAYANLNGGRPVEVVEAYKLAREALRPTRTALRRRNWRLTCRRWSPSPREKRKKPMHWLKPPPNPAWPRPGKSLKSLRRRPTELEPIRRFAGHAEWPPG